MSLSREHGKVVVAIIAMLTLSVLMVQCSLPPRCQVRTGTMLILLGIIGSMLGVENLSVFRGGE